MSRYSEPYVLIKQKKKSGIICHYRLQGEKTKHSTGKKLKGDAKDYVEALIKRKETSELAFRDYAEPFFLWDRCPHILRLRSENKSITRRTANNQRIWLNKYILKDPIADKLIADIIRADLIDLRQRHMGKVGNNTLNKIMETIKIIFKEAVFREDLQRDPTAGIGMVKYEKKEAGIFTPAEIADLFPVDTLSPWKDLQDYTCFLIAATIGMRRGEILALEWQHIDFDARAIRIVQAWKGRAEKGAPKWEKKRAAPLPNITAGALKKLYDDSLRISPTDLVFCYDDGARLGETWWRKRFVKSMKNASIDRVARNLKPHSFRHTLNTLLLDADKNPEKVRAALGWTNIRTQRDYLHLEVDHLRDRADFVDEIFTED